MSKININNINAKEVVVGDHNNITVNNFGVSLDLNDSEKKVLDEILSAIKNENDKKEIAENVENIVKNRADKNKNVVIKNALSVIHKTLSILSNGVKLYDKFSSVFLPDGVT